MKPLPFLSSGVEELSGTGFEFISHSLLGSPLSRELGAAGQGLRGGALLITGAKVSSHILVVINIFASILSLPGSIVTK